MSDGPSPLPWEHETGGGIFPHVIIVDANNEIVAERLRLADADLIVRAVNATQPDELPPTTGSGCHEVRHPDGTEPCEHRLGHAGPCSWADDRMLRDLMAAEIAAGNVTRIGAQAIADRILALVRGGGRG